MAQKTPHIIHKALTSIEKDQLRKWMNKPRAGFELLYKATQDGLDGEIFHKKCDNKGATVTVAFNAEGWVFGGYASQSWKSEVGRITDDDAFLFRLRSNENSVYVAFPIIRPDYALFMEKNLGPTFGSKPSSLLLWSGKFRCTLTTDSGVKTDGSMKFEDYVSNGHTAETFCGKNFNLTEVCVYQIKDDKATEILLTTPWRTLRHEWTEDYRDSLVKEVGIYDPPNNLEYLKILLLGERGAGKSSFLNTIHSVFKGRVSTRAFVQSEAQAVTKKFRVFHMEGVQGSSLPFQLCDSMGFEEDGGLHINDICPILDGHISNQYEFKPDEPIQEKDQGFIKKPSFGSRIHCIGLVVDAYDSFIPKKTMKKIHFMTSEAQKRDRISTEVQRDPSLTYCSPEVEMEVDTLAEKLCLPKNKIIPIRNYESETELATNIDILALMALQKLLNHADDYIKDNAEMAAAGGISTLNIKS